MYFEGLADELAHRVARVERADRVLEDDLHVPAQRRQFVRRELGQILAPKADRPGSWFVEVKDGPPGGRLPAPAFSDQPERLAAGNRQAYPVDSVDRFVGAQHLARPAHVVVHDQVVDLEQRGPAGATSRSSTSRTTPLLTRRSFHRCRPGSSMRSNVPARSLRGVAFPRGTVPWPAHNGGRRGTPR